MEREIAIRGMHCGACVERVTKALMGVPGVESASVTLEPPRAVVRTRGEVAAGALGRAVARAGDYSVVSEAETAAGDGEPRPSLYPLVLIVAYIAGTVLVAGLARAGWAWPGWRGVMLDFMGGFFLVFSFFKLLDLRGFADAYRGYDLVAKAWPAWALAYPFAELALGVAYVARWNLAVVHGATLVLMLIGAAGVLRALMARRAIRCACLGTVLNLPMTTVTLVEDLGMAAMAAAGLLWGH